MSGCAAAEPPPSAFDMGHLRLCCTLHAGRSVGIQQRLGSACLRLGQCLATAASNAQVACPAAAAGALQDANRMQCGSPGRGMGAVPACSLEVAAMSERSWYRAD